MAQFDKKTLEIVKRLQQARIELLKEHPFYALLLLHLKFAVDISCETAYTDGTRIAFNPDFINSMTDIELKFVLMHEVLHVVLCHPFRHQSDYDCRAFDIACDLVVNSTVMDELGVKSFSIGKYGEVMHVLPNGMEGLLFSVEEAYQMVLVKLQEMEASDDEGDGDDSDGTGDSNNGSTQSQKNIQTSSTGNSDDDSNAGSGESDSSSDGKTKSKSSANQKKQCKNHDSADHDNLGDDGESDDAQSNNDSNSHNQGRNNASCNSPDVYSPTGVITGSFDDHSFWDGDTEDKQQTQEWLSRMINATEAISIMDPSNGRGTIPACAQRMLKELTEPQNDWRTILENFIQEEINDYSFSPPDRRFADSPFFLPDFNEKDERVENILFMIDTSGSMSDTMITEAYSEIKGAIDQFDGKLQGWLGFFDAVVVEPQPFENEEEFSIIRPIGGGGTSFDIIFDYVKENMMADPPVSIVILTDGYAPFPEEEQAMGIPVLWIINNEDVTPEWGKVARIKSGEI